MTSFLTLDDRIDLTTGKHFCFWMVNNNNSNTNNSNTYKFEEECGYVHKFYVNRRNYFRQLEIKYSR